MLRVALIACLATGGAAHLALGANEAAVAHGEWPTYAGRLDGQRHSPLTRIDRTNVTGLRVRWRRALDTPGSKLETTPLVRGESLFATDRFGGVRALEARTGRELWAFPKAPPAGMRLCCGAVNRGVAAGAGRVYTATLDARLVALHAASGHLLWEVSFADPQAGYSSTGAPLAVRDMIIVGVAGGEFRTRGFLAAFDAATGARRWKFHTIPEPGQRGHETWSGETWRTGGVPTWMTGTFDPGLDLLFWGTGNPGPDYDSTVRPGDNLYSNSLLALDPDDGELVWHFQYTPGDDHDWDGVQVPVLAEQQGRRLVLIANRNGFFYALERETGRFLRATPFVHQTWALGIARNGRPLRRLEASPAAHGTLVYPGRLGGTNWWPPAYDPQSQTFFVLALERGGIFFRQDASRPAPGGQFLAGRALHAPGPYTLAVRALDAATGRRRWEHRFAPRSSEETRAGGLLATAAGLVFAGDDTRLVALDSSSGESLWALDAGGPIHAPPITYESGGEQFVAVAAGHELVAFALGPPRAILGP